MSQYTPRVVSIKTLCLVSQAILVYIDKHGTCTASKVVLAEDCRLSLPTIKAALRTLVDLGAFVSVQTWHPATRTVRSLSLPPWPVAGGWYLVGRFAFKATSSDEARQTAKMAIAVQQSKKWAGAVALIGNMWRDVSHEEDPMEGWNEY